jgi:hypothetical protein
LLSGIPSELSTEWNADKVRLRVVEANKVLLSFLETACHALREPSFQAYDWHAPLMLYRNVVAARLDKAMKLQQALKISDDELYETLWSDTLNMLIQVERIALQPENEALDFNSLNGPLGYNLYSHQTIIRPLVSSYRFIDNLARERNRLWQELRPIFHPTAAVLPPPWSAGLPIQCLLGSLDVASKPAQGNTPFLAARAAAIVFLESSLALSPIPEDSDVRTAIGPFVDSYNTALQIYVLQSSPGQDRAERTARAWAHALRDLTGGRMTWKEAFRTWKAQFLRALASFKLPDLDPDLKAENYPMLPTHTDPLENIEWDPTINQPRKVDSRALSPTYLDCLLAAEPDGDFKVSAGFEVPDSRTQDYVPSSIWSLYRFGNMSNIPFAIREGLIVSAMLFLDSKKGGSSRILASPFPSELDVRYPPLFLDPEFLLRPELHESSAREILRSFISMVPPALLAGLADATLNVLLSMEDGKPEVASLEHMAYGILSLLLSSDRPQLASHLVLRAIIDRPDASSWHRAVLNVGLARKLPARDAQALLSSFTNLIQLKLEEQARLAKIPQDGQSSRPKPIIKVTTVKHLAQILNKADFVPPSFTVDVLSKLLGSISHLDIRVAVVESLLELLGRCTEESSTPLAHRALSALETTIPLVGGVSERYLMREEDWLDAERTGVPPAVYDDREVEVVPPILSSLVQWTVRESKWCQEVVNRILLPIVECSRASNARWIKIFSTKHQLALNLSDLSIFPIEPLVLSQILNRCLTRVPASVLDLYQQFVLANVAPSREIAAINDKIRGSGDLRASNEGRHWLSLYGHGPAVHNYGGFSLARTLRSKWNATNVSDGIHIPQVQRLVFEQAEALLKMSDYSFTHWDSFVSNLQPPIGTYQPSRDKEGWLTNGRRVLERIIERIDSLRTTAWQQDPYRQPAVLPSTFNLRLWLLSYPCCPSTTASISDKCKVFAEELSAMVDKIVVRGMTYHEDLHHLRNAASSCPQEYQASVACHLGSLPAVPAAIDTVVLLRVELAEMLFQRAKPPHDEEVREAAKDILNSWRESQCEQIRMRGLRITNQLQLEAPGYQGWNHVSW